MFKAAFKGADARLAAQRRKEAVHTQKCGWPYPLANCDRKLR